MFKVYGKLFSYIPKEKKYAYIAIVAIAVSAVLVSAGNYYIYRFLHSLIVEGDLSETLHVAYIIVACLVSGGIIYFLSLVLTHKIGFRIETNLRKRGIDGLTDASFKFFDKYPSGKVRKIIDDNAEQTHTIVAHLIPDLVNVVVTPILTLAIAFYVDWKIGVGLVIAIAIGMFLISLMDTNKEAMNQYMEAMDNMNAETVEYIRGMQVIKIFGISVFTFKSLHKAIVEYSRFALKYSMKCRQAYVNFLVLFNGVMVLIVPFIIIFSDLKFLQSSLVISIIYGMILLGIIFTVMMRIMYLAMYQYMGNRAVDNIEKLYGEMQQDKLAFGDEDTFENFDIEFDNVTFGYDKNNVIEKLSFKLPESKIYALVGSSGSGKSTIAKLVSGFYNINGGSIKLGGKDISAYSQKAIMKNIAFIFQDAKLFKTSILENVMIGDPAADRGAALKALSLAGCDEILDKFKDREDTVIGSKGVFLSGGEQQRIAIARGILKNANIIIMDEACAATDPENEHELQKAFANLMKGKTVIMIAHRLSSIKGVDEVLVLDEGKIVERGSHDELMRGDTRYKTLQNMYQSANEWRV